MKYSIVLLVLFTIPLFSMEAPPQSLQQKLAAAQLHNRTQCPLAKLPREIQDHIAEYLEFNDRESDEEFVRNTKDLKKVRVYDPVSSPIKKIPHMSEYIQEKSKTQGWNRPNRGYQCTNLRFIYSRDKSKIIMFQSSNCYSDNYITYFLIYDLLANAELYFTPQSEGDDSRDVPVALSNDGRYFFRERDRPPLVPRLIDASTGNRISEFPDNLIGKNFNKQSTKAISALNIITLLCSEQEHKERSKKTLALYFHQKGICKPFNYTQVNS